MLQNDHSTEAGSGEFRHTSALYFALLFFVGCEMGRSDVDPTPSLQTEPKAATEELSFDAGIVTCSDCAYAFALPESIAKCKADVEQLQSSCDCLHVSVFGFLDSKGNDRCALHFTFDVEERKGGRARGFAPFVTVSSRIAGPVRVNLKVVEFSFSR
jgi:hypothetical protein